MLGGARRRDERGDAGACRSGRPFLELIAAGAGKPRAALAPLPEGVTMPRRLIGASQ